MRPCLPLLLFFLACSTPPQPLPTPDTPSADLTIFVTQEHRPLVEDSIRYRDDPRLKLQTTTDPAQALQTHPRAAIPLLPRSDCTECYRLQQDHQHLQVTGGLKLGLQYGLHEALEAFGYRAVHPLQTKLPETLLLPENLAAEGEHAPEVTGRRGLHLHTLHPIEAMYDFWMPSPAHLEGALRTLDFIVANRGNYVQWAALDNIWNEPESRADWQAHTRAITTAAHARGLRTSVAIQLFGLSNLQKAFDLIDTDPPPVDDMEKRLHLLLDGNGFDDVSLSFGEFFGADPDAFVTQINHAYDLVQQVQPGTGMTASVHVGNSPSQHVTYKGKELLYYFLVQYANPAIVPLVHTVMYYNLFEDAGGAYGHQQFDAHRQFLQERQQAGKPVGYHPESAYWVAFDCSVPTFLPVYLRSRWLDLHEIRKTAPLTDHVLFTSGWEWGYWLNDVATLRMTFALPKTWDETLRSLLRAWGQPGAQMAETLVQVTELQHQFLIAQRLAPYLAGRDAVMDLGEKTGIVAQPPRQSFAQVLAMDGEQLASFEANILQPLDDFAAQLAVLEAVAATQTAGDPWLTELAQGVAITAERAKFVHSLYATAVAAKVKPQKLTALETLLAGPQAIVAKRHVAFWDHDAERLTQDGANPTLYQYGYLREADRLCYWKREWTQLKNLLEKTTDEVPSCVL